MTPAPAWDSAEAAAPAGGVRWAARRSGAGETVADALSASWDPLASVKREMLQPHRTARGEV